MSKATHMLAMAGMALVAGAAFGASPAAAAPAAPQAATGATSSAVAHAQSRAGDRVVGYFSTRRACERAGRVGEFLGRWDDSDCNRVWWGPRRGWWVLTVDSRWHGNNHGGHWGHDNGGHWGHHQGGDWGHHRGDMRGR
jgi:hypothetical protein